MGIVSELGDRGKGFVATGQGGVSPKQGWIRGQWERPDPPGGMRDAGGAFPGNAARNCPEAVGFARSARVPAMRSASTRGPAATRPSRARMRAFPKFSKVCLGIAAIRNLTYLATSPITLESSSSLRDREISSYVRSPSIIHVLPAPT